MLVLLTEDVLNVVSNDGRNLYYNLKFNYEDCRKRQIAFFLRIHNGMCKAK